MLTRSMLANRPLVPSAFGLALPARIPFHRAVWIRSPQNGRLVSVSGAKIAQLDLTPYVRDENDTDTLFIAPKPLLKPEAEAPPLRLLRPFRKLMSYNVQDFYQTPKNKQAKSKEAIAALAEVIERENPDVIALQEVGDKGLLNRFNLNQLKGRYPNIVSNPVWAKSQHQLAFLSKGNIKIVDTKSHWKDFCKLSQGAAVRDLLEATFETDTGYRFTVFNSHLKSMRGGEAKTAPVRLKEAKAAANLIREYLDKHPDSHVFITGDLNSHFDSEDGKPVIETLERLGRPDEDPVFTEVTSKDSRRKPTNRAFGFPDSKLDYTFTSKELTPLVRKAYVAGDFDESPWQKASDHLPLVTVFEEGESQAMPLPALTDSPPTYTYRGKEDHKQGKKRKLELIA